MQKRLVKLYKSYKKEVKSEIAATAFSLATFFVELSEEFMKEEEKNKKE